jgi:ligand-binding sensor domain-containing protein/signal transduction histidine kinase
MSARIQRYFHQDVLAIIPLQRLSRSLARAGVRHVLLRTICLTACLFGTSTFALDPQKAITQFVHTSWTEKDGAPTGIRSLAQTNHGYLWIGTAAGLFRFDGLRFVRFEPQAGESLPRGRIDRLLATRDGSLWFASATGDWYRIFNGHLSKVEDLPVTNQLVEAPDGMLVAATEKGLWQLKDGFWRDVSKEWNFPGRRAVNIYFDKSGTLWVVAEDLVVHRPAGQTQFVAGERVHSQYVYNLAEAPDGTMWISELSESAHSLLRTGERGPATEIRVGASGVLVDRNGSLWVASAGDGLRRVADPNKIKGHQVAQFDPEAEQFTVKEGLSGNVVLTMLEDREGNIWAGTVKGLDRFREGSFIPVAIDQPEAHRFFYVTHDGSLLVPGPTALQVLRIGPLGKPKVIARGNLGGLCEVETGDLWGVSSNYFVRYHEGVFVTVPVPGDAFLKEFSSMVCDQAGGMLIYDTTEGLFRLANGVLTSLLDNPERNPRFGYLYADRMGRIWLAQSNRVQLYEHGKWQVFGNNDGVPLGTISAFHMDRTGNVWAGGEGGLSKFENGRFRSLSKSNGLPAQVIYGIAEDDYGCLWLASDSGVLRVPIVEFDRALADPVFLLRYESFDVLDGLPGKPLPTLPRPIIARTFNGRIWFATTNGIAYVDPQRIPKNNLPPPVQVESLSASGQNYAPWGTVKLSPRTTSLEITYTALSLTIPERIRFRYKLEGVDHEWQEVGTRRIASYSNLGPGAYRFRVLACNNDGVWNEVGATLNFRILPAWYQTIWFRMLYVLLALVVIWMLYSLRFRHATARLKVRFDERLAERTRIARELHDTLLQTVQGSKLVADDALEHSIDANQMRGALEKLSGWLGQATQEGRAALDSLRTSAIDMNDLAAGLRRATRECVIDSSVVVKFSVAGGPREMHPIARDEIYRIGYEAIRNACEHAAASELEVSITYGQDLMLSVRDNGVGMGPAVVTEGKPGHFGLQGMRERAKRIGSKLTIVSAPGSGTVMTLIVPGKVIFRKAHATRFQRVRTLFRRGGVVSDSE